jgi:hypothetical protein
MYSQLLSSGSTSSPPPLLALILNLYRPQSANLLDCDWLATSGSDCQLVHILTLHSSCLNDCD